MTRQSSLALLLPLILLCGGACSRNQPTGDVAKITSLYIVMEKVLADAPGRPRTTLKVIIPDAKGSDQVREALEAALAAVRGDDPALKTVIIWAYRARDELNGSNYTLGKLEWSADGKDFTGAAPLSPNPKLDIVAQ